MRPRSRVLKRAWSIAALGAALVSGVPAPAQETHPADADVIKAFNDISASPNSAARAQDKTLQWRSDIHVAVLSKGPAPISWLELIGRTLADLEPLIPVKIGYATDSTNFAIMFVDDNDAAVNSYKPLLTQILRSDEGVQRFRDSLTNRQELCNNVTFNAKWVIGYHLVWVYTKAQKPETSVENCIVRSIIKGLGLGRYNTTMTSVFNPKLNLRELSALDKAMVRTFFAAAIPPGSAVEDAQAMFAHRLRDGTGK